MLYEPLHMHREETRRRRWRASHQSLPRGSTRLHQLSKRWADSREIWGLTGVQALGEFMKYDADLWRKASAYKGLKNPRRYCFQQ